MTDTFALTSVGGGDREPLPVTNQEEKELKRVFVMLSDYARTVRLNNEISALSDLLSGNKSKLNFAQKKDQVIDYERFENNAEATTKRIDELEWELGNLAAKPDKSISIADVTEMLKRLGAKVRTCPRRCLESSLSLDLLCPPFSLYCSFPHLQPIKAYVEEMLWEVDEDLDNKLTWTEFKLMFTRNILDKTGLEPSRMFNLTQFLIYDHNENGMVSKDETMNFLYVRYGAGAVERKLRELFGDNMKETGREGGEISYQHFIDAVEKVQMDKFWKTNKGRNVASKGGLAKNKNDEDED